MNLIGTSTKPIRILYMFAALPVGGAERLLVDTLHHLDRKRFDPSVCVLSEKGPVGEEIEKAGIPLFILDRMKTKQFDFCLVLKLFRLLNNEHFDILHTHLYHSGFYGRLAARLIPITRRPKIFHTLHNIYPKRRPRRHWINRVLSHWTDAVIAVSEDVRESVLLNDRISPEKVTVVENGIDVGRFKNPMNCEAARGRLGISKIGPVIGCVARLTEQKGIVYLLRAFPEIQKKYSTAKLLLVGDGDLRNCLIEEAKQLGVSGAVLFMGTRTDIPEILSGLDVFVLPSLWEGLGLAAVEAMAAGVPVVGTRVPGLRSLIIPDKTGLMVEPADPAALSRAILAILENPSKIQAMVKEAREYVDHHYSIEAHARRLETLYEEILACKKT